MDQDTIVAIATPAGRGGIGVVRVSGPAARRVVAPLLRTGLALEAGRARLVGLLEVETGDALDEAVVTFFAAPHSYTTEDVVEIACHGAPVLLEYVVRTVMAQGARLAKPGEFTERAYLAGRLDLTQAEAVHDLVAASTLHQARVAAAQLGGSLARELGPVKEALLDLMAELEAGVDFAEDDLDLLPAGEIAGRIAGVAGPVERLLGSYRYGRVLREGFRLALVGRPNAGKSSLFNRLLGRERAIVTDQPGTTRDAIGETMAMDGIPVELVDTAGLREAPAGPEGEAERAGIERTGAAMAEADLVVLVVDRATLGPDGLLAEDAATVAGLRGRAHLVVLNKADLAGGSPEGAMAVSALTGFGIDELRGAMVQALTGGAAAEGAVLTNLRQHEALAEAGTALGRASAACAAGLPHEMLLLDLQGALAALDTVTGATGAEEILHRIFAGFCIGK